MQAGDMLHHRVDGAGTARRRVVLVHGFTQSLDSMAHLSDRLARSYEVVRVDLPGHGGSGLEAAASFDTVALAIGEAGGRAAYVGYSMGGRLCLRLALQRPDLVTALVTLGASPGIADAGARAARAAADDGLADEIVRDGVESFLETWLALPLFATLPPEAAHLDTRLANSAEGLAGALRVLNPGRQEALWEALRSLQSPALFVAGALDERYAGLAETMAAGTPDASTALVREAGHAAHLERPDAFAEIVESFLAERYPAA
jgi:2-succinyl-6-hydroxy-2,4-cyclohexadiene-1-carboxylate synthase